MIFAFAACRGTGAARPKTRSGSGSHWRSARSTRQDFRALREMFVRLSDNSREISTQPVADEMAGRIGDQELRRGITGGRAAAWELRLGVTLGGASVDGMRDAERIAEIIKRRRRHGWADECRGEQHLQHKRVARQAGEYEA